MVRLRLGSDFWRWLNRILSGLQVGAGCPLRTQQSQSVQPLLGIEWPHFYSFLSLNYWAQFGCAVWISLLLISTIPVDRKSLRQTKSNQDSMECQAQFFGCDLLTTDFSSTQLIFICIFFLPTPNFYVILFIPFWKVLIPSKFFHTTEYFYLQCLLPHL